MKNKFRMILRLAMFFCLTAVLCCEAHAADVKNITYKAADTENPAVIHTQSIKKEDWLFLPSSADRTALAFEFDAPETAAVSIETKFGTAEIISGEAADLSAIFREGETVFSAKIIVTDENGKEFSSKLNIAFSANIRSMYITSADPEKEGRAWIEKSKDNKAKGNGLVLLSSDGEPVFDDVMKNMKGRGNSTWDYDKKPYQIKLKKSADLLKIDEKADTWVLLANVCDGPMVRTNITFNLARNIGLDFTPYCEYVDLYYDGEYRGTYLLSEKTEIGKNRIEITDLESAVADANTEDVESMPTAQGVNAYGCKFQYIEGAIAPDDITGGYLLEMDYTNRALEEASWFTLRDGSYVVIKSPEFAPYEAVKYISEYFQGFVDAVDNGGVDPYTGKQLSDYVDYDSLIKCLLIQEFSKNGDAFASSAYFYKDAGSSKMYAGPVWDFDTCYGGFLVESLQKPTGSMFGLDGVYSEKNLGTRLMKIPQVRSAAKKFFKETFAPAVRDIMLGGEDVEGSIRNFSNEVIASQRMNYTVWPDIIYKGRIAAWDSGNYDGYVNWLVNFVYSRLNWMDGVMTSIDNGVCSELTINARFPKEIETEEGTAMDEGSAVLVPEQRIYANLESFAWTCSEDGSRTLDVILAPANDAEFLDNMKVTVNGGECSWVCDEDGRINAEITFAAVNEGETPFADVDSSDWYYNAILEAYNKKILSGVELNRFSQRGTLSRAMLVSILWRIEGEPEAQESIFVDVKPSAWYAQAAAWANENGIVEGIGDNYFAPDAPVTREQLMCVFQRYAAFKGMTIDEVQPGDYRDTDKISAWAVDGVAWAADAGLYGFAANGMLRAQEAANRAEVAWVVTGFLALTETEAE